MFGPIATFIVASTLADANSVNVNEYVCMVEAIHFEAKGENYYGKVAVANVIANRVSSDSFPSNICGVVKQKYQFSYRNGVKPKLIINNTIEEDSFEESARIALLAINNQLDDNTDGSDHYYAHHKVEPYWANNAEYTKVIGNHTFAKL